MQKKAWWAFIFLVFQASFLHSKILNVPRDFLTIKAAVGASQAGDIIEVEDGFYFEKNIIVDKNIRIESRNLFGAVIYGSVGFMDSIFIVRAEAEISGFVLQNSFWGILQRHSPDVTWTAHDLVIMNMANSGISINDRTANIGSAILENIYVDHCHNGIATNDARDIRISGSLISSCSTGLVGSDHISFVIEKSAVVNCGKDFDEAPSPLLGQATNKISIGRDVFSSDLMTRMNPADNLGDRLSNIWKSGSQRNDEGQSASEKRFFLLDKLVGDCYFRKGEYEKASKLWLSALSRVRALGFPDMTWRIELNLARASERLHKPAAAVGHLQNAVDEIIGLSQDLPFKYFQDSFFEDKIEVFDDLMARLYEMCVGEPTRGYAGMAFLLSEKFKSLGSWSGRPDFIRTPPDEASDAAKKIKGSAALHEIVRHQRRLADTNMTEVERRGVLERLEDSEDEYKAYLIQQKKLPAGDRSPSRLLPLRPEEIQKRILDQETALVEFFLGSNQAYVFLLTSDSLKMIRLSNAERLNSLIPNYLDFLKIDEEKEFRGAKGGRILFDALLAPLNLRLFPEIKKLIIVPDGNLHYLPFDALVLPPDSEAGAAAPGSRKTAADIRFLFERYEVRYAPSAAFLVFLLNEPRRESLAMDLLALANPGSKSSRAYPEIGAASLPKLRFVGKELEAITGHFPGPRTRVVPGESSSEEYLKSLDLSRYRIIHFAAHGLFDEKHWWRSCLLLDRGKGSEDDGLLQPLDIVTLHLDADLVVLSACASGSGRIWSGKSIVGLHQSFFLAGARAVLATLWAINDRSTVRLMDKFYSDLKKGKSASESLRSAKQDLIRSGYSHPRYWAAFVLSGASSSPIFSSPAIR
jgi:CHAT domain-containing protein